MHEKPELGGHRLLAGVWVGGKGRWGDHYYSPPPPGAKRIARNSVATQRHLLLVPRVKKAKVKSGK